ncbi:MAG: hypothetical protein IJL26_10755, partial [Clostridia bacterium]|nr:hypothetical protein [Clostridia bacterium]
MKKRENVPARRAFAFNKLLFALLAAALLLTGCNKRNAPPADVTDAAVVRVEPTAVLKAPYSDQDSLNPFFCTSYMNASLAPLLYEGLFLSDVQGNITLCAASSYTETEDGVVVAIPTASRFSDGSAMTSADVVYSFDAAKNSALYRNGLAGIDSAVAVSPYEIKFTFSDRLPGRVGALTFPLVKTGTAEGAGDVP